MILFLILIYENYLNQDFHFPYQRRLMAEVTPYETPYTTPYETPYTTPFTTPYETPIRTPYQTTIVTPYETPFTTPQTTPNPTTFPATPFTTPMQSAVVPPTNLPTMSIFDMGYLQEEGKTFYPVIVIVFICVIIVLIAIALFICIPRLHEDATYLLSEDIDDVQ